MKKRADLGTVLLVTVITILIWHRAAVQALIEGERNISIAYDVAAGVGAWRVEPRGESVNVTIKGSSTALSLLDQRQEPFPITVNAAVGSVQIAVQQQLADQLAELGITILRMTDGQREVDVDRIVSVTKLVTPPSSPRFATEGQTLVEPREVRVDIPSRLEEQIKEVVAELNDYQIDALKDGIQTIPDVALRVRSENERVPALAVLVPATVTVRMSVMGVFQETDCRARIQLAGPAEDEYRVEFEERVVVVRLQLPTSLAPLVESGQAQIVGLVHLKSSEKEGAERGEKPITCFLAILPNNRYRVIQMSQGQMAPTVRYTIRSLASTTP